MDAGANCRCIASPAAPIIQNQKMMEDNNINKLAELITAKITNCSKEVLTADEAASYMGISKSYLYKLTMSKTIPHYKPMGKMVYFNRLEIEQWLQSNRYSTDDEIASKAATYTNKKGGAI